MKNTQAIINMTASRAEAKAEAARALLLKKPLRTNQVILVEDTKKIEAAYKSILKTKPDLIIIGGGDGTIIKTIDWFKKHGYQNHFGIIPLGTANYLARNLAVPLDPKLAVKNIASGTPKEIQFATADGKLFSLMATIGLLTRISKHVKTSNKKRFGQLAYFHEGIKQLKNHDSFHYTLKLPKSGKSHSGRAYQIVVFNADLNKQLKVAPSGNINEPWLKLSIYKAEQNTLVVLLNIVLYILSLRRIRRGIKTYKGNRFNLTTNPPLDVSIDGELSVKPR